MDYLTIAAVLWLVLFVLIGIWRGFWFSFAALASLLVAYAASTYLARPLSEALLQLFDGLNINPTIAWLVSASGVFILAGLLARFLVLMIGRALPVSGPVDKLGGGLVSSVYGAALGLFLVWGFAFLQENLAAAQGRPVAPQSDLVRFARQTVAALVRWNIREGGGSQASAQLSAAVAERPAEILGGVREALQAPAFAQAANSAEVQDAVREQDPERLQNSLDFQQLLRSPGVVSLRQSLAESGITWTDAELAAFGVEAAHNVERVRTDPEFIALYNDPEVQAFLNGEAQISPSLLQKGRSLLNFISNKIETPKAQSVEQ